jgi:SAM-dependent methyltransferase
MTRLDDNYAALIRACLERSVVRSYVTERLEKSLSDIGLDWRCRNDVCDLLLRIASAKEFDGETLGRFMDLFERTWRPHLDRAYLHSYEAARWRFAREMVLSQVGPGRIAQRALDVGCGRGCITTAMVKEGIVESAFGIDAEDFESEWTERKSECRRVDFAQVHMRDIESWLWASSGYDLITLYYVLHHSEDHWTVRTLRALHSALSDGGQVLVLEDALGVDEPVAAQGERQEIGRTWLRWYQEARPYSATAAFDVQVVLDFVAVQILAGFSNVKMPCAYKPAAVWAEMFRDCGYKIRSTANLGFPEMRDIDVPQTVFVLERS